MTRFTWLSLAGIFFIVAELSLAQPPDTLWTRTFGGVNDEGCWGLSRAADGGFFISGYSYSFGPANCEGFVVRTDSNGQRLWQHTYSSPLWSDMIGCVEMLDGGLAVVGQMVPEGSTESDIAVLRTDANGEVTSMHAYGYPGTDWAHKVKRTPDGGLIIAGESARPGRDDDFWILRTDAAGETLWTCTYGGEGREGAFGVQMTHDGGYIVCGPSSSYDGHWQILAVRLAANGDSLWSRVYDYGGFAVVDTIGNGFLFVGRTYSDATGLDFLVIRTDSLGNIRWTRSVEKPGDEDQWDICRAEGGLVVVGSTTSFQTGTSDVYVVRMDESGDTLWTGTYGGSGEEVARQCLADANGRLVIAGLTNSFGAGGNDMYLLALHSEEDLIVSPARLGFGVIDFGNDSTAEISLYNPSTHSISVLSVTHINPAFVPDTTGLNGQVLPHSRCVLHVSFSPAALGTYLDTLVIIAQQAGDSVIRVAMSGEAEVLLPPVENLTVHRSSPTDIQLGWAPVTHSIGGHPVSGVCYIVYGSTEPDGPFVPFGYAAVNSYVHPFILNAQPVYFYQVTATVGAVRGFPSDRGRPQDTK